MDHFALPDPCPGGLAPGRALLSVMMKIFCSLLSSTVAISHVWLLSL